jgi:protoheme IX farnesyltransferase
MERTASRPIPAGRISPRAGLTFGITLAVLSFVLMSLTLNVLSASLAFGGFAGYVGVYTIWLKRRTLAQHRDRRRRRRDPAAGRLGG